MPPFRDPETDELFPSKEYYMASKEVEKRGLPRTTSNVRKAMSGEFKSLGDSGDLSGTLKEPSLKNKVPTNELGQLSLTKIALDSIAQDSFKKGITKGLRGVSSTLEGQGFDLKMSRGGIGNIVSFVENQLRSPMNQRLNTFTNLVNTLKENQRNLQATARSNLSTLISTGAIQNMNEEDLVGLGETAGIPEEQMRAIKRSSTSNAAVVNAYAKAIESGNTNVFDYLSSVPSNMRNQVMERIDWSKVSSQNVSFGEEVSLIRDKIQLELNAAKEEGRILSDTELFMDIKANADYLNTSDIQRLIDDERRKLMADQTIDDIREGFEKSIESFKARDWERDEVRNKIETTITERLGLDNTNNIPDSYKKAIKDALDKYYPPGFLGATPAQNLTKFGKGASQAPGAFWRGGLNKMLFGRDIAEEKPTKSNQESNQ